jgi:hypothetical protein
MVLGRFENNLCSPIILIITSQILQFGTEYDSCQRGDKKYRNQGECIFKSEYVSKNTNFLQ